MTHVTGLTDWWTQLSCCRQKGARRDTESGKRFRQESRGRERDSEILYECVFGGDVDCPLALSGACAHSAWLPAYSAPHADPIPKTPHNTQSKVTHTLLPLRETAPFMLLTDAPHRHTQVNTWQVSPRHINTGARPERHTATWRNVAAGCCKKKVHVYIFLFLSDLTAEIKKQTWLYDVFTNSDCSVIILQGIFSI